MLTHEPKAHWRRSWRGEILREGPPPEVVARFTDNILTQNARTVPVNVNTPGKTENRQEVVLIIAADVAALFRCVSEAHRAAKHHFACCAY